MLLTSADGLLCAAVVSESISVSGMLCLEGDVSLESSTTFGSDNLTAYSSAEIPCSF